MSFQAGDVLVNATAEIALRVLHKGYPDTWLFDLKDIEHSLPFRRETKDLLRAIEAKELFPPAHQDSQRRTTDGDTRYAQRVYARLEPVLSDPIALMTRSGRATALKVLQVNDTTLEYKVFLQMLRDYFAAGGVPDAITSRYHNCGPSPLAIEDAKKLPLPKAIQQCREQSLAINLTGNRQPTAAEAIPRKDGKPRKYNPSLLKTKYRVDESTLRVFYKYYEWIKDKPGRTVAKAYEEMCLEVFSSKDAMLQTVTWDLRRKPSIRQFRDWYVKFYDFRARRLHKKREKEVDANEREILGSEYSRTINAGAIGSGDATVWNVALRSRFPTREIIGPPVVFRIRCPRTGMLLGLSIGLDSASWNGFATAIANCLEDKVAFCAGYGITISHEEWPIQGLPSLIEADCGETDNTKPNPFIHATGVGVKNITGARPDIKPGTESDFFTLQVSMNGDTPGALVEKWQTATNREWRVHAELDIDDFIQKLLRHELQKMKNLRPSLELSAEMTADAVNTSPLSMWNWHVANRGGGLRSVDPFRAIMSLLERDTATITGNGITFRGLFYVEERLLSEHAFARARRVGSQSVDIGFDPRLVDNIYIFESGVGVLKCRLNMNLEWQLDYPGKSFREVKSLDLERARVHANALQLAHSAAQATREADKAATAHASAKTKASSGARLAPAAQLRGLKAARELERNVLSPTQALRPPEDSTEPPAETQSSSVVQITPTKAPQSASAAALRALIAGLPSTKMSTTAGPEGQGND